MSREEYIELIVAKLKSAKMLNIQKVYVFARGLCTTDQQEVQEHE